MLHVVLHDLATCPENELMPEDMRDHIREQDRLLPMANVARLMSKQLTPSGKVSHSAKQLMQEAVTEFICFITSQANAQCLLSKRNAITIEDIINAIKEIGMF